MDESDAHAPIYMDAILASLDHHSGNSTSRELACSLMMLVHEASPPAARGTTCPPTWDSLLCWPKTQAGTLAIQQCMDEFNGIKYDTSENATRWCHLNGTWDNYTDYDACSDMFLHPTGSPGIEVATTLYYIGFSVSLVALSVAVWIFVYFKDLRCLRNTIHTNLMSTYMLADFIWILTITLQMSMQPDHTSCIILIILLTYLNLTNFFWMFVEGLYLYMLVVETFTGENIRLRVYIVIGWGAPVLIVVLWSIVKSLTPVTHEALIPEGSLLGHCPWMSPHPVDWIFQAPMIGVLAVNTAFLVMIMWVLITKLRSANNVETQQYRKATKALLVLIPLLGITYIVMMAGPTEGMSAHIYTYIRAVMLSTQGLTVAIFYCFLNTEVQNTVRHHFGRWKEARSLAGGRRYNYNYSKDWSPRSRTESIRLNCSQPNSQYRKRESNVSEATLTTTVGGSARTSNGSGVGVNAASTARASSISPFLTAENAV